MHLQLNLQLAYNMTLEVSEAICVLCAKHICCTYMQRLKKVYTTCESVKKITYFFLKILVQGMCCKVLSQIFKEMYKDSGH